VPKLEFFCIFIPAVLVLYCLSKVTTKRLIFIRTGAGKDVTTKRLDFIQMGAAEKCTQLLFHVQRDIQNNYFRGQYIKPPNSNI
jgi:hypothetical protein